MKNTDNPLVILKRILNYSKKKGDCLVCYIGLNWQNRPQIKVKGKLRNVSRVIMYLVKDFDLDSEFHILHNDDICKSKACIEVNHLRVGTHTENMYDSRITNGTSFLSHKKDYCLKGHPRTPKNLNSGGGCLICQRLNSKESYARRSRIKSVA